MPPARLPVTVLAERPPTYHLSDLASARVVPGEPHDWPRAQARHDEDGADSDQQHAGGEDHGGCR
jgi:hypothetical protein